MKSNPRNRTDRFSPHSTPPTPRRLDVGETVRIQISARQQENYTGVLVQPGDVHTVTACPGQTWYDGGRPSHPPDGDPGTWLMNLFARTKRAPKALWFALIAETEGQRFDLSRDQDVASDRSGVLILYANDTPGMYWNNTGEIEVVIVRKQ